MNGARLMIVDDDHTMVSLLQTLLELDGFEVLPTTKSDGLVDKVMRERPDLVLMDVYLSDQDGIELLRALRATPEVAKTPIIMSSGMDVSDQCLEAGADGFMLKPYSPPDLIDMIREKLT
jgi:DNA-binding response OmpR family regulator